MNSELEVKLGSVIVGRLGAVRMSESERQAALNAMRDADLLVDAFVWIAKKVEQLGERMLLKPSPKH